MKTDRSAAFGPACLLACLLACLGAVLPVPATAGETFTDRSKTCTMKITSQEKEGKDGEIENKGLYLVGIICEQRKVLSYWNCQEPERAGFTPFECLEKETQYVDPIKGSQSQSRNREMRIYAPDIQRVPYVLCGRLCDPSR